MKEWLKEQYGLLCFKMIGGGNFPRRIEFPLLLKWLDLKKGERVLDVACGRGGLTLKISSKSCRTIGIDLSAGSTSGLSFSQIAKDMTCHSSVETHSSSRFLTLASIKWCVAPPLNISSKMPRH